MTGWNNNIIVVVDEDAKDEGIEEFDKYIVENGKPQTISQSTPSGGYHYFFKHTSSNDDDNYLIENFL